MPETVGWGILTDWGYLWRDIYWTRKSAIQDVVKQYGEKLNWRQIKRIYKLKVVKVKLSLYED